MDMVHRPNGTVQLLHNGKAFATAKPLPARKEWKVLCHAFSPWTSMTSPKPTNVKFFENRKEAENALVDLAFDYLDTKEG